MTSLRSSHHASLQAVMEELRPKESMQTLLPDYITVTRLSDILAQCQKWDGLRCAL